LTICKNKLISKHYSHLYLPSNQQVVFPRVTVSDTGDAYSVILQYHAATANTAAWLEVIQAMLIQ